MGDFYHSIKEIETLTHLLQDSLSHEVFWARLRYDVDCSIDNALQLFKLSGMLTEKEFELQKNWRKRFQELNQKGKQILKSFLKPGVTYYPIDYFKRFDETIVCDLNGGVFPDLEADVSVLNGVLEFLTTAEPLLLHVCERTRKKVILSYMTVDHFPSVEARRASGYVSDLTEKAIVERLEHCGFSLIEHMPDPLDASDTIYLFQRLG